MNYLRGALQYYKDLPPINPSTLTGAIDVIVVQRPNDDGDFDLASSPFHVRFGKWQILRPGDKKVTVTVNGNIAPFPMKIGEAGEAFFVFQTDDDITEDMATSPLTSPLQSPTLDPVGKTGAGQFDDAHVVTPGFGDPSNANVSEMIPEPEFLDLDAVTRTQNGKADLESQPDDPSTSNLNLFGKAKDIGKSLVVAAQEGQREGIDILKDEIRDLSDAVTGQKELAAITADPDTVVKDSGVELTDVQYRKDIVLDTQGYHSKEEAGEEAFSDYKPTPKPSARRSLSEESQESVNTISASRPPSPGLSDTSTSTSPESHFFRGRSAPPNLELPLSSSPPDYEWDWGGFPHPSPLKGNLRNLQSDAFQRASSLPPPDIDDASTHDLTLPSDEVVFGVGGLLNPDPNHPYQFILDLDGTMMSFQLSLCGYLDGMDEVGDSQRFEDNRITWRRFMAGPNNVRHKDLTIQWGDKCVSRADQSPLFAALVHWRDNTLSSQGYVSEGDPVSSGDELSEDESARDGNRKQPPAKSSWSRWWKRGWAEQQDGRKRGFDLEKDGASAASRPAILPTHSDPTQNALDIKLFPPTPTDPVRVSSPAPAPALDAPRKFAKTLRLTSDQLKSLGLKSGPNEVTFSLSNTGITACTSRIFLWDADDHIVVSDIDGTITKSDALGHVLTLIGRDWTHIGVAKLYTDICRNGYKVMYLTSRAIGQADSTRDYLKGVNQNNQTLPEGPVIMSPDRLFTSLHREVILRKPEQFKMACLRDIAGLFGSTSRIAFYAGFGNRITDALSYRSVGIPSTRIFTIDSTGEVKTQLLERAGYKSSYTHMSDLVDQQFPPIHRKWAAEYTDFNFWRPPLQEIDFPILTPPSPALTAKSEGSVVSRLRHLSLGRSSLKAESSRLSLPDQFDNLPSRQQETNLRSMSSLNRLKEFVYPGTEATDKSGIDVPRARHMSNGSGSMPGSLNRSFPDFPDDLEAGSYEEDMEDGSRDEGEIEEGVDPNEDDIDDLFDEAGEMKNVPFL